MIRFSLVLLTTFLIASSEELKDVDWRGDFMSPIGNQHSCGGCVGFSVAGALEWYAANVTGYVIPLSVQYLVDCSISPYTMKEENGCSGGVINSEIKQIMAEQYIPYDEDYKYVADFVQGRCEETGAKDRLLRNALADVWLYDYIPLSHTPEAIRKALQTGPTIHGMYIGSDVFGWKGSDVMTDNTCATNPAAHAMTFVGWQGGKNPYYIVRNSYGTNFGEGGYVKYADNEANEACIYTNNAFSLKVGRRRELEYQLGVGKLSFVKARQWCQGQGDGWDLAHIPTEMHNFEVYDMFTETYGSDKKKDEEFNYFWIGLFDTRKGEGDVVNKWVWVSGDPELAADKITGTDMQYYNFASHHHKTRYGVMKKVNNGLERQRGSWTDQPAGKELRFVCSRYREEACPRISQNAIGNAYKVTFLSPEDGSETLEIVKGTRAKVTCMEGYTMEGDDGECNKGVWKHLPVCFSKNPCTVVTKKMIKKSKSVSVNGLISNGFADEGSSITVICKSGYVLATPDESVCKNGEWTIMPKCLKHTKQG